jgi:diguanylate cyclase (GGDEF)-like protein/PAS domain S-box-containing protein
VTIPIASLPRQNVACYGYLLLGALSMALYELVPPLQGNPVLLNAVSASSAGAILIGIHRNRPVAAWTWRWFAIGQGLFALGDIYTYSYPKLSGQPVPFPSFGDALYILVYPALMIGVLLAVRRRSPHGDRAGVIDALIITMGVALLSWMFLMAPYAHDGTLTPLAKAVSIAYPLGDVLVLAAAVRLTLDGGRRTTSFYLLISSVLTLLVTDAAYGRALLDNTYNHQLIYDAGWMTYYVLWGAAALHPSMRSFAEATPDRERRLGPVRLGLLTLASLIAPIMEFAREQRRGDFDMLVIIAASATLFLLAVARMAGLVMQNERALARERALRSAGVALVAATATTEIADVALQTALALVDHAGETRLLVPAGRGMLLLGAGTPDPPLVGAESSDHLRVVASTGATIDLSADEQAMLLVPSGMTRATIFELAARGEVRGLLIVTAGTPLSPILIQAVSSLAAGVSLALESAALKDEVHRRESEARFGSLVRNASDLITVVDEGGIVLYQSPSIERILGYDADGIVGTPFEVLVAERDRTRLVGVIQSHRRNAAATSAFDCTLMHHDGRAIQFEMLATDLLHDEHVRGIVLNSRDVSERAKFEEQLAHQAFHDPVTQLPNRALFSNRVGHALTRAAREQSSVAVIFFDLDDFKTINDSLGHSAGDEVLREVGRRVLGAVRDTDTAARFGGDEFAVLIEETDDPEIAISAAERIVAAFEVPIRLLQKELFVRPSIGIALSNDDELSNADDLIRNADAAMYIAKRDGKGGYRVFEPAMHATVLERLELRAELQRAIETNQFELHFQPVIRLHDGTVAGVEALVRWHHPTRGLVPPGQFIPLAEEMGLIVDIGRWVLQEGCRHAAELQRLSNTNPPITMSVNLSVKQLQHPDIVQDVRDAMLAAAIQPSSLVLEITESVMMADADMAAARLGELKELGVRIAMDDFGTGYSSLSYLSRFPVDILKMDRSFLLPNRSAQAVGLAAAIVSLGETLSLDVVAEGIELPGQLETLRTMGCDLGQGFLIAHPMTARAAAAWLTDASGDQPAQAADAA